MHFDALLAIEPKIKNTGTLIPNGTDIFSSHKIKLIAQKLFSI